MVISMLFHAQLDRGSTSTELASPAPKIQHTCEEAAKVGKSFYFNDLLG
jgi:hypothetical protein